MMSSLFAQAPSQIPNASQPPHVADGSTPALWAPQIQHWSNRYAKLCAEIGAAHELALAREWAADALPQPRWVARNGDLAEALGWPADWAHEGSLAVLSGGASWPGSQAVATAYSGHQFGVWAGQLGDGRALLLGELITQQGPQEFQLKGSGPTPYARSGDGRAVLRSSVREYLCSEAMHALGVPTTRALALVASPLPVYRETQESAAIVTRVAPSFARFGHVEHLAFWGQGAARVAASAWLAHHITTHFPHLPAGEQAPMLWFDEVVQRTADLMAAWQSLGFCHGVMNTDNMSLLGLTLDYGPFGFMDAFDPGHICNHSDTSGRYAWDQQPGVAAWNLRALGQALLSLLPNQEAALERLQASLEGFGPRFERSMQGRWRAKLGLQGEQDGDLALIDGWLNLMARARADFTLSFRRLNQVQAQGDAPLCPVSRPGQGLRDLFVDGQTFDAWLLRYRERLALQSSPDPVRWAQMDAVNPLYVLRNHLAEAAIKRAQLGDDSEVQRLYTLLKRPFEEQPGCQADAELPPDWAAHIEVSCSS